MDGGRPRSRIESKTAAHLPSTIVMLGRFLPVLVFLSASVHGLIISQPRICILQDVGSTTDDCCSEGHVHQYDSNVYSYPPVESYGVKYADYRIALTIVRKGHRRRMLYKCQDFRHNMDIGNTQVMDVSSLQVRDYGTMYGEARCVGELNADLVPAVRLVRSRGAITHSTKGECITYKEKQRRDELRAVALAMRQKFRPDSLAVEKKRFRDEESDKLGDDQTAKKNMLPFDLNQLPTDLGDQADEVASNGGTSQNSDQRISEHQRSWDELERGRSQYIHPPYGRDQYSARLSLWTSEF